VTYQIKSEEVAQEHLVVIFAYHFPPENAIGGVRPFQFYKYLLKLGHNCQVFTASVQKGRCDPHTQFVADPFSASNERGIGWHLERAIRKVFLPGALGTRWSTSVTQSAREHLRTYPRAKVTILSTFPPLGPHFAAWRLERKESSRWIADFRDPFPTDLASEELNVFQKWAYRWLECALLRRADAVIVNTDAAKLRLQQRFPYLSHRVHLIWNGFDPENGVRALPMPARNYKVLSHVGELYAGRNVTPILESVERLVSSGRLSPNKIRVRLIGPIQTDCVPKSGFIQQAAAQGWLQLLPRQIPKDEARQVTQTSDGLLLLQPQSAVQVPGKLFEYLQIGRPILAFVRQHSPSERLLDSSGVPHRCVYPDSSLEKIDATLVEFLDLSSEAVAPSSQFQELFNVEHQTRTLEALIHCLHEGS
jgi:hypothetical protein